MKATEGPSTAHLEERLLDVERELAVAPFRRLYAGFIPVLIALAFFPLLKDTTKSLPDGVRITYRHGTLWQMVGHRHARPADIGILIFACLIVLLLKASSRRVSRSTLIATAILAILGTLLFFIRPDIPGPRPGLAPAGNATIAILYCLAAVTAVHASWSKLWSR